MRSRTQLVLEVSGKFAGGGANQQPRGVKGNIPNVCSARTIPGTLDPKKTAEIRERRDKTRTYLQQLAQEWANPETVFLRRRGS